jgi:flagellar hook-length control protein FliK
MTPAAPQSIPTAAGPREPISTGAPPGAPPEGPPFQSALETESARTAIAEGQQQSRSQDPSPTGGEQASLTEAFDRAPHGSALPARRHSGHRDTAAPAAGKAAADLAPAASALIGCAPTPAGRPAGTSTDDTPPGELAGGDVNQSPVAELKAGQPDPAIASGTLAGSEEGAPNARATGAHDDALPSTPTGLADGVLAIPREGTSTASAPATSESGTTTSENGTATTGVGTSVLASTLKETSTAGGAQGHSTPAAPHTRGLANPVGSSAGANANGEGSTNAGGGEGPTHRGADHTAGQLRLRSASDAGAGEQLGGAGPTPAGTDGAFVEGESGGVGGPETSASPLVGTALNGSAAGSPAEPGSGAYAVGLQEAIESLHGTIQLAARQGLTQARISLQPEELGEIRINLTQTAQGLLARVSAESPAAAQALAAAHTQLRQSLSSLGINLTRLDIGHHDSPRGGGDANGGGQGGAARGEGFAGGRPGRSTAIAAPADSEAEADSPSADEPATPTTAPLHGGLIDVLA